MKKYIKVLGLLLVAAMFVSCSNPSSSSSSDNDKNKKGASASLFSPGDTTIPFTPDSSFKLTDGKWTMLIKEVHADDYYIDNMKFTISENGTKATLDKYIKSMSYTITDEEVEKFENMGMTVKDNKVTEEKDLTSNWASSFSIMTVNVYFPKNALTNEDKTKFYSNSTSTHKGETLIHETYLMKD